MKKLLLAVMAFLSTNAIADRTEKIKDIARQSGVTGDVSADVPHFLDLLLVTFGWGLVFFSIGFAGLGLLVAANNNRKDKKSDWTLSSSIFQGALVIVICIFFSIIILSFR